MNAVTIIAHHCENRHEYRVTFEGHRCERRLLRWMDRKGDTHAFAFDEENVPPQWAQQLWSRLFPLCHHGLSLDLCADPVNHYPRDDWGYW